MVPIMSVIFENSNTKTNLMKAFAGESQARTRYTFAASQAKKDGLEFIEKAFTFTADQEKEHAELFYKHLHKYIKPTSCMNINIEGGYPFDLYDNSLDMLKCARHNEYEEYKHIYKSFGDEAKSEGFEEIANLFYEISEIEKIHGDRFGKFIELIESDNLFKSDRDEAWFCLNCGHIHVGKFAPNECPVCKHGIGYQIRHNWILL